MKIVRQLNLEKKEKIGDRGVSFEWSRDYKNFAESIHTSTYRTALLTP